MTRNPSSGPRDKDRHPQKATELNILITGGEGTSVERLPNLLTASDHNVLVHDAPFYEEAYRMPVEFAYGDVRDCAK